MTQNEADSILAELNSGRHTTNMPTIPVVSQHRGKDTGDNVNILYKNCTTGEEYSNIMELDSKCSSYVMLYTSCGDMHHGFSFAYDKGLDMLVIFTASFDLSYIKKGETRDWVEISTAYVNRDKNLFVRDRRTEHPDEFRFYEGIGIDLFGLYDDYKYIKNEPFTPIIPMCENSSDIRLAEKDTFDIVCNYFGSFFVPKETNRAKSIVDFTTLISFLEKETRQDTSPEQAEVDVLTSYKLKDITEYMQHMLKQTKDSIRSRMISYSFSAIERVDCDEPVACIRNFSAGTEPRFTVTETGRVYFTKDHTILCASDNNGNFTFLSLSKNHRDAWGKELLNYEPDIIKDTSFKYIYEIIEKTNRKKRGQAVYMLLTYPEIEKLYKAGYKEYVMRHLINLDTKYDNSVCYLSNIVGALNPKGKTIYQIFGLNKHQMDMLFDKFGEERTAFSCTSHIVAIKFILSRIELRSGTTYEYDDRHVSITDIDQKSFDTLFYIFDEIARKIKESEKQLIYIRYDRLNLFHHRIYAHILRICSLISCMWGLNTLYKSKEYILKLFYDALEREVKCIYRKSRKECRRRIDPEEESDEKICMYRDYLDMVYKMEAWDLNKPYFDTFDDIKQMHDSISSIFKIKEDEMMRKKLTDATKRIEKFAYKNDVYRVIVPKCPNDFIKEGQILRHCVGSYLDTVTNGETNIMFIRKNTAPDKPFFTVEISNNGTIEQIHGLCNRNLSSEPDLIPFVDEWQKKVGLGKNSIDKIR